MDYNHDDNEHDEDNLPIISLPHSYLMRNIPDDNNEQDRNENKRSSDLLDHWRNLYNRSLHALQSDDSNVGFITKMPLANIDQQSSIEQDERVHSPISQQEVDLSRTKSKWKIRLPELLNRTVGPDRQKHDDRRRRHTTDISLLPSTSHERESNLYKINETDHHHHRSMIPIVQQLRQKFDRMALSNNTSKINIPNNSRISSMNHSRLRRMTSLTGRSIIGNNDEYLNRKSRSVLPVHSSSGITSIKSRSSGRESANRQIPNKNDDEYRVKTNPPVSYPKYNYPPPSVALVVRQLISGGATLVYDSSTERTTTTIQQQQNIEEKKSTLANTNSILTSQSILSHTASDSYTKHNPKKDLEKLVESSHDESNENLYEPILSRQASSNLSEENYMEPQNELLNHDRNINDNESENYYPDYEMG